MVKLIRYSTAALAALLILVKVPTAPHAAPSAIPALDKAITYVLPQWIGFATASSSEVQNQIQQLHSRLGPQGRRVRLGFTVYVYVDMAPVDPGNTPAVKAQLASTFAQIDHAIEAAASNQFPICVSILTATRYTTDSLQAQAQQEDRRNMQWHSDNSLASGWTTLSRYARKQEAIQEAYIREIGRFLAARMLSNPDTLVAASGDGEIELSYDMSTEFNAGRRDAGQPSLFADYSPFAVAEFRDWLRGTGLYAADGPFAGEAYRNSDRYHTASIDALNADFQTNFNTWSLKQEDWSLSDSPTGDPHAIPSSTYSQGGWQPVVTNSGGFHPPPTIRGDAWSDVWHEFRQMMVWRHNLEFAKWITTSADPASGATVPADRWFSDQIPADYLFGFTPQNPNPRYDSSASAHWSADVSPYGSLGITSFNTVETNGFVNRTLAGVAPLIAQRNVRWGIFEWSPSIPASSSPDVYREEMLLVERYHPSLLAPFYWRSDDPTYAIEETGFEVALRELIAHLNVVPLTLSRSTLVTATTTNGALRTPPQVVRVGGVSGESPAWGFSFVSDFLDVAVTPDGRGFTVATKAQNYPLQPLQGTVTVASSDPGYAPATLTVTVNVAPAGGSAPPFGSFDTPGDGQHVSGEVGVTGWAVDDIGITGVDIYRSPVEGEPGFPKNERVFLGAATLVPGARPDVQSAYSVRPLAEQAGWGYMLLSNMLPNQGNGSYVLHAVAKDVDGHPVTLGSRTIVGQNSLSHQPFGTIDTPLQGQTVSGTIINFGWALTPQPSTIPVDGSTIGVYIDGIFVGHPVYNNPRSDIAGLFPGYNNTNGAVGYFEIDTRAYSNGVHTIAWVVTDSAGNNSGIGSRYFTIANP